MDLLRKKEFTNGFVSLLGLEDGMRIETTATCLPISTEMRGTDRTDNYAVDYNSHDGSHWSEKAMIGVSTQSGCPVKCKFCAVNDLTEKQGWRNLEVAEIVGQVEWARQRVIEDYGYDPVEASLFRVLFTRMGEPALNSNNVIEAAKKLKQLYPNVRIQISTIGFGKHSDRLVTELILLQREFGEQFIELQFSIHSTSDEYRQWLQHGNVSSNHHLGRLARHYNNTLERAGVELKWKVTLNFALTTETPFDLEKLKEQFESRDVFIKVSPINENNQTEKNDIKGVIIQTNTI